MNKHKSLSMIALLSLVFFNPSLEKVSMFEKITLFKHLTTVKVNAKASVYEANKYVLLSDDNNNIITIKQYQDDDLTTLIKVYQIKPTLYNEALSIESYLSNKLEEVDILKDTLVSKSVYQNNALTQYITYQNNIVYSNDSTNNSSYYETVFDITNNIVTKITTYPYNSSNIDKIYTMKENVTFTKQIKDYQSILYLNKDSSVNKLETYTNNQVSQITYYYPSNVTNDQKRIKQDVFLQNNQLLKEISYYENQVVKEIKLYYPNTTLSTKHLHLKQVIKNNTLGYIAKHEAYYDNSQKLKEVYLYKNKTIYGKNDKQGLKEIVFYTFNRGKQVKTGSKVYENTKLIKSSVLLKDVPYYNQVTGGYHSGCEFFSLKMALAYKGSDIPTKTLYKGMKKSNTRAKYKNGKWYWANPDKMFLGNPKGIMTTTSDWGINALGLQPLANKYRASIVKDNASLAYIESQLLQGNPVIVWGSFRFRQPAGIFNYIDSDGNKRFTYGNYHVYLVIGMDDKYVYVQDPAIGKQKITKKQLKQSYTKYGKKVMVIT